MAAPTNLADGMRAVFCKLLGIIGDDHVGTRLRKACRDRKTDPPPAASDQCNPAFQ
jgi:hypothetical protein